MSTISEFLSKIRPTDGPGYSDAPEVDVQTHRSIARTHRWIGYVCLLVGAGWIYSSGDPLSLVLPGTLAAFAFWNAMQLRVEALEWEMEEIDDE